MQVFWLQVCGFPPSIASAASLVADLCLQKQLLVVGLFLEALSLLLSCYVTHWPGNGRTFPNHNLSHSALCLGPHGHP